MGDFEVDTRVEGGNGSYSAVLSNDWEIWGPNGGYIASIALRAAGAESAFARPASFNCQYLGPGRFEAVDIEVVSLRRGRSAEALRVSIMQGGRRLVEALIWTLAESSSDQAPIEYDDSPPPDVPDISQIRSVSEINREYGFESHRFWQNFERWSPGWVHPDERVARPPRFAAWHRFEPRARFDCPFADAARALLLIDTNGWPAATMPWSEEQGVIAPSLDLSVQFHRDASDSDLLLCESEALVSTQGMIGTRGRVWDADRRLVASGGSQLLVRPVPTSA